MTDPWLPPNNPVCSCCSGEDIDSLGECHDCYHGDCGNRDCEDARDERNYERFLESYYGGDFPTPRQALVTAYHKKYS